MSEPVAVTAWVDFDLAEALNHAVADARDNRANYVRRLLAEHLREAGYMQSLPSPRRVRRRRAVA